MAKRSRRKFKASTVTLLRKGEKSIGEVAKDLGVLETSLRLWVKQADINAGRGPLGALTTDERLELVRLRRENKVLQMEREILKKATAFFPAGTRPCAAAVRVLSERRPTPATGSRLPRICWSGTSRPRARTRSGRPTSRTSERGRAG